MPLQQGEIWTGTEAQGGKTTWKDTGRTPGEGEGRDGDDASANQGSPNSLANHRRQGRSTDQILPHIFQKQPTSLTP